MTPQEKNLKLEETIKQYRLNDWIATCPGGFQTLQTISWKKLVAILGMTGLFVYIFFGPTEETGSWFIWFVIGMIILAIFGITLALFRKTIFDLDKGVVRVEILGKATFQRPLADFEKFTTDAGHIREGIDSGAILYLHFKGGGKLRLVQLRDKVLLDNLKQLISDNLPMALQV